jgi:hypothetical protein
VSVCQEDLESVIWAQSLKYQSQPKDRFERSNTQKIDWYSSHTNFEHSVQNVLAQVERSPHHNSIENDGLLESKLTSTSLRLKVGYNYLCQESMHRSKSTNIDMRV